ncbi:MAG TPA: hypothetical protein VMI56_28520 [Reyranella sp.]|nr:hypothetical protein [Reyranella sp.]
MEVFAALGLYLILAFLLPGFCYLLFLRLCFPGAFREVYKSLPPIDDEDNAGGYWLVSAAVVGGLLLSSLAFALELVLRDSWDSFEKWYPEINFGKKLEGVDSYVNILVPSAIMHLNIGSGLFLMLLVFLGWEAWRRNRPSAAPAAAAQPPTLAASIWLSAILLVLAGANMYVAHELFHRICKFGATAATCPTT